MGQKVKEILSGRIRVSVLSFKLKSYDDLKMVAVQVNDKKTPKQIIIHVINTFWYIHILFFLGTLTQNKKH